MTRFNGENCGFVNKLIECARIGNDEARPASPTTCQKVGCDATILVRESTFPDSECRFTAVIATDKADCAIKGDTLDRLTSGPQKLVKFLFGPDDLDPVPEAISPDHIEWPPRPDDLPPQLSA